MDTPGRTEAQVCSQRTKDSSLEVRDLVLCHWGSQNLVQDDYKVAEEIVHRRKRRESSLSKMRPALEVCVPSVRSHAN